MRNHLISVALSDCELFSNLEWVQHTYTRLSDGQTEPDFPLHVNRIAQAARESATDLRQRVIGRVEWLSGDEIGMLVQEIGALHADRDALTAFLHRLAGSYPQQ